uniref:FERM, ARHGEF and pleckstrin domain-containing protein 2 n=1 Tax=Lepisosteus oculatus TaxID=7918 RepID=W5MH24_LEPOC|nr:PREDICTED: FERM, RhoGEF and pleckstrin domain-containing protein 2 isoform X1 [Lepisosteus oculatus]XP_015216628.1 PREDICTED: FERM, RhoGEF and pleckstrin domain-containing protein 2 isoform X1 [Lepisosteus oculatus]XP_015216629.1 PREDICTED: FERM, RhoGEF and pleckstrin domain-containing protein 2 isoform X1 [Lepisosteus oculatus]XP_015216630.1 PREDICTED: FERM, RhoGEF and pleckstrin domain-containing protein 2 isoform X1 [Lepisosteus oculatus]XP_015216631.1 PREDICTED: FERM, RhoGEF and pleckstr
MGEIEGSYRVLQTPGTRLGAQANVGISTLEPGQSLSTALASGSKGPSRGLQIRVQGLDNTQEIYDTESKSDGQSLLTEVFKRFNIIESDYFGLEYQNLQMNWMWLEPLKLVVKQVRRPKNTLFRLSVKFFPPDPGQLQEEYTRYLFALQMKRDLTEGRLTCTENTAALLASHLLQSEIGDYDDMADREYLKLNKLLPNQERVQEKIMEFHRRHVGQTPAESDFQVLEIARKLEMYGVRFHPAADREGTKINLSVAHMGLQVFQGNTKINTFNWSKIRKLSFKRKRFLIKLHPEVHGPHQDTLEFLMASRDQCKVFWKNCVEYHTFFRLFDQPKPKSKAILFSRGSSFRYSGRTQKQLVEYVRDSGARRTPYQRRNSRVRMSTRSLAPDVPKQSLSFSESLRVPGSPSSATISFHSLHAASTPPQPEPQPARPPSPPKEDSAPAAPPPHYAFQGMSMDSPQLSPYAIKSPLSLSPSFQMSTLSLPGQAPSPLQSPVLSEGGNARLEEEEEGRRKRYPADKAYFIAKEILTTERTYLKDLEVITVWFRSAVIKENAMPEGLMTLLFSNIDPVYEFHRGFLKEIDQRLALWEGRSNAHVKGDYQRIGDVMLRNMCALKEFTSYLQKHDEVLTELEKATKRLKKLETVYKEFELQKVCYLPLNTFLLKPIQRLMHYKLILERLCKHYSPEHRDYKDCKEALKEVAEMAAQLQSSLIRLENFQKLTELQRDLIGIDSLIAPGREFIREGCLYKLTKKGLQQRMFFLFSDMLLYTSKGVTATNQFKVHGQLPLHGMILIVLDAPVEESENEWSVPHCFTIYSAQRTIVVAASSKVEMGKWIEDLNMAIDMAKKSQEKSEFFLDSSLCDRSNRSSDEVSLEQESEDDTNSSRSSLDKQTHHRANTTMHVCWHRNTSVSMSDHSLAVENQLSGYLLRKFKNSNGWQKLWVVFTNFCLFFYKTHQDDFPLASLPLLGYTVSTPAETDSIHKEYVFKLQFKSHVYFFRAESEYTFERWMEVIKSAASATGRMSLLIPREPPETNGN